MEKNVYRLKVSLLFQYFRTYFEIDLLREGNKYITNNTGQPGLTSKFVQFLQT